MSERTPSRPGPGVWKDTLLTAGSETLLGAMRNYVGPVRTPYDKRDLADRLEAFLRRAETQESLVALLDALDARIIGTALLLGPAPEHELKGLFEGELPLFDLGVRMANLFDRLILFRYQDGARRLVAVNPLLSEALAAAVLDPATLFGTGGAASSRVAAPPDAAGKAGTGAAGLGSSGDSAVADARTGTAMDARTVVGFFSFLFHSPGALRKAGGLTKRAAERAAALFPGFDSPGRLDALAQAFSVCGAIVFDGEEWRPDGGVFTAVVSTWGEDLPFFLAACLADSPDGLASEGRAGDSPADPQISRPRREAAAGLIAAALRDPPGGPGFVFSRGGLERWLGIAARRAGLELDCGRCVDALAVLGLADAGIRGFAAAPSQAEGSSAPAPGRLVAEGAHALYLMPEASLEERIFVGSVARPVSFGTVWNFEVERDAIRRAFASGLDAKGIASRLESMSGASLPQSLAFSLSAWEDEYRALRLYRGVVLAADERLRPVIERAKALEGLVAEVIAPGLYFLSSPSAEAAAAVLALAGLEASPRIVARAASGPDREASGAEDLFGSGRAGSALSAATLSEAAERIGELKARFSRPDWAVGGRPAGGGHGGSAAFDPAPRLGELRSALDRAVREGRRGAAEAKEFSERIERRIVLTERQIAEAEPRSERLEAGGLDYLGKVRVIERALRSSGDRLELLYRLPGDEPVRALLRPVKLERNDKGLVLEAEDLATGGPARIPLGAVSTVRRVRATLFGEDT